MRIIIPSWQISGSRKKRMMMEVAHRIEVHTKCVVLSRTYCGTPLYRAPEIAATTPYNPFIADVWSLGVVLFAMVNNSLPFLLNNGTKVFVEQQKSNGNHFRNDIPSKLIDLVYHMLQYEPTCRFSVEQCMAHEWSIYYLKK